MPPQGLKTSYLSLIDAADNWEKLNSIILVESTRIVNNKQQFLFWQNVALYLDLIYEIEL